MPTLFHGTVTLATFPPPNRSVTFCGLSSENRSWNAAAPADRLSPTAASICVAPPSCTPAPPSLLWPLLLPAFGEALAPRLPLLLLLLLLLLLAPLPAFFLSRALLPAPSSPPSFPSLENTFDVSAPGDGVGVVPARFAGLLLPPLRLLLLLLPALFRVAFPPVELPPLAPLSPAPPPPPPPFRPLSTAPGPSPIPQPSNHPCNAVNGMWSWGGVAPLRQLPPPPPRIGGACPGRGRLKAEAGRCARHEAVDAAVVGEEAWTRGRRCLETPGHTHGGGGVYESNFQTPEEGGRHA